ncbi:hypothetical protein HDU88_003063 [Geranomyces variabilis]|nr:hypothetical protein HDU88_003063 [Geranomyces variabilis]
MSSNKPRSSPLPPIPLKSAMRYSKDSSLHYSLPRPLSAQSRPSISRDPYDPGEIAVTASPDKDNENSDMLEPLESGSRRDDRLERPTSAYSRRSYISNLSSIHRKNLMRFGLSKCVFLVSNTLLTFLGLSAAILGLCTLLDRYSTAALVRLIRTDILLLYTITSALAVAVGLVGFLGAFTHRKNIISIHNLLLWPIMAGLIVAGYLSFHQRSDMKWRDYLSDKWDAFGSEKAIVQDQYACCGFYSSLDRPLNTDHCTIPPYVPIPSASTVSAVVDPATFPGCYEPWHDFTASYLEAIYISAFSCIPLIMFVFIVGLLAANHIYD